MVLRVAAGWYSKKNPQVEAKRNVEHLMLLTQNSGKIDVIIQFRGHNHAKPQFEPEDQPKSGVVITLAIPMLLQFALGRN